MSALNQIIRNQPHRFYIVRHHIGELQGGVVAIYQDTGQFAGKLFVQFFVCVYQIALCRFDNQPIHLAFHNGPEYFLLVAPPVIGDI